MVAATPLLGVSHSLGNSASQRNFSTRKAVAGFVAQALLPVLFDFPLGHPTNKLEGALSFAISAKGGLLRSNTPNSPLFLFSVLFSVFFSVIPTEAARFFPRAFFARRAAQWRDRGNQPISPQLPGATMMFSLSSPPLCYLSGKLFSSCPPYARPNFCYPLKFSHQRSCFLLSARC